MASALVLLAEGFEEIEAVTIIDILRRGGVEVNSAYLDGEFASNLVLGANGITVEADIPLNFVTKGMRLTGFVDYGIIKGYGKSEKRGSIGAQIEWKSPIGPVNFIFAKGFNKKPYDRTANFEFTIGSKF